MQKKTARPFLKWAGGKTQLLRQFERFFPPELKSGKITRYFEPFLGGGAVFFFLRKHYRLPHAFLSDINPDLISAFKVIQKEPDALIKQLKNIVRAYLAKDEKGRKSFFLEKRKAYNVMKADHCLEKTALMIFLNKTCYNGLFRLNSRGEFNTPHGLYRNPAVVNVENIRLVSDTLKDVTLTRSDFSGILPRIRKHPGEAASTFVYFDPPYRPLNATSNFTAYSKSEFGDDRQRALARVFRELDRLGVKVMLSNSDPKNEDPSDDFFDKLYAGFTIRRIPARRMINSRADRRGRLSELVITNY